MRTLLHPKWILILNTAPIVFIMILFGYQYQLIKTFLGDNSLQQWKILTGLVILLVCFSGLASLYHIYGKKLLTPLYAIVCLVAYSIFLYYFSDKFRFLIPRSVPNWNILDDSFVVLSTAIMPTLAHALLVLIIWLTPEKKEHSAFFNFFLSLLIPGLWYIFAQLISPIWDLEVTRTGTSVLILLALVGVITFLFFFSRCFYIIITRWSSYSKETKFTYLIFFTLLFPVLGLLLNSSMKIFGDLSSYWFYGLAVVNGLLLCIHTENLNWRLAIFIGRCITLPFTLYFLILFLPYLPLSLMAIVLLGVGLLMLTPIILFPIHINALKKDLCFLSKSISNKYLYALAVVGFLAIPFGMTYNYLGHKQNLSEALNYIYNADYSQSVNIDKDRLRESINAIKVNRSWSSGLFNSSHKAPYINAYYNWLVLDNLSLSREKVQKMEHIFFGTTKNKNRSRRRTFTPRKDYIELSNYIVSSQYDVDQDVYKLSLIHI